MKATKEYTRSRQQSTEKIEAILNEASSPGCVITMWESKPKGMRFTITAYMVKGEIVIVQMFDDGSCFPYLQVRGGTWDLVRGKIIRAFPALSK